jgi:hypothetical protein
MKRISFGLLALSFVTLTSCYHTVEESVETDEIETVELSVDVIASDLWQVGTTRATATTRATNTNAVIYPIHYFVFDTSNSLVASEEVESASSSSTVKFTLSKGKYNVYALCGVTDTELPTLTTLTPTTQLSIVSGGRDISLGSQEVTVGSVAQDAVTIEAAHAFTQLDLTLKNVPSDVASISATLSPLYDSFTLGGKYYASATDLTAASSFTQSENAGEWLLSSGYIYPTTSSSLSISLTATYSNGSTQTFLSTASQSLAQGQILNLSAPFPSNLSSGSITVTEWSVVNGGSIEFTPVVASGSTTPSTDQSSTNNTGTTPPAESGTDVTSWVNSLTLYGQYTDANGVSYHAMVISKTASEIVLMGGTAQKYSASHDLSSYEIVSTGTEATKLNVVWTYPTQTQWETVTSHYSSLTAFKDAINDLNGNTSSFPTYESVSKIRFAYLESENTYKCVTFNGDSDAASTPSTSNTYVFPVATITLSE